MEPPSRKEQIANQTINSKTMIEEQRRKFDAELEKLEIEGRAQMRKFHEEEMRLMREISEMRLSNRRSRMLEEEKERKKQRKKEIEEEMKKIEQVFLKNQLESQEKLRKAIDGMPRDRKLHTEVHRPCGVRKCRRELEIDEDIFRQLYQLRLRQTQLALNHGSTKPEDTSASNVKALENDVKKALRVRADVEIFRKKILDNSRRSHGSLMRDNEKNWSARQKSAVASHNVEVEFLVQNFRVKPASWWDGTKSEVVTSPEDVQLFRDIRNFTMDCIKKNLDLLSDCLVSNKPFEVDDLAFCILSLFNCSRKLGIGQAELLWLKDMFAWIYAVFKNAEGCAFEAEERKQLMEESNYFLEQLDCFLSNFII